MFERLFRRSIGVRPIPTNRGRSLRQNVIANFLGRGWTSLLGLLAVPLYLRLLGIESYGLIGFFATVQGVLGLFDLGLGATINRELARLSAEPARRREQRDVLGTLEVCYWLLCITGGVLVYLIAPVLARHWIRTATLSPPEVQQAIRLMGLVVALQLPFSFYQSALMGLERLVLLNGIVAVASTARTVGTLFVLWRVAPSIEAFFLCQLVASLAQTGITRFAAWRTVDSEFRTRFRGDVLRRVWPFSATVFANSLIGISLTQLDKVLLSRLLPLDQFGYYVLAGTVASVLWQIIVPFNQALYPRFAQLFELQQTDALTHLYHRACQSMAILLVPLGTVLILFAWQVLFLWTGDQQVASATALIAALLVAGALFNGLASVPGYLQSAAGWPQLVMYTNLASAVVLVPSVLVATTRYGSTGAAVVWLVLNMGYVMFNVPLMHRRLLRGERREWYVNDVGLPVAATLLVVSLAWLLRPELPSPAVMALYIVATWLASLIASAAATPYGRTLMLSLRPAESALHTP